MLSTKKLILELNVKYTEKKIKKDNNFNFDSKRKAYILTSGRIISYGERDYTQVLKKNDPIGFAESILARKYVLQYKRLTDITLLEFDSKSIRDAVNKANIAVIALIKYCLARIFNPTKTTYKGHYLFEEEIELSLLTQRRTSGPEGLAGGEDGLPGEQILIRADGTEERLASTDSRTAYPGDRLVLRTPGGGGAGEPELLA